MLFREIIAVYSEDHTTSINTLRGQNAELLTVKQILSVRFCCVPLCGVPLNHESNTEDFLFFVFQSVSRANTVNMNAPPLPTTQLIGWNIN
jgi:hypothetical protein